MIKKVSSLIRIVKILRSEELKNFSKQPFNLELKPLVFFFSGGKLSLMPDAILQLFAAALFFAVEAMKFKLQN
jgi:hypothetical protein